MSSTQAQVAIALMKKVLPDLATTEITGEEGGPVQIQIVTGVPRAED